MENILAALDGTLNTVVSWLASIILFDFGMGVPLVVAVLLIGGVYYSFYFGWYSNLFVHLKSDVCFI